MEKNESELIEQTMELFMQLGIKSVTMDDISRQLGMSKKTLYKYVSDKNELVEKVLTFACECDAVEVDRICDRKMNAIDEAYEISNFVMEHIRTMHPSVAYDLKKYHSTAWQNFKLMKRDKITECFTRNMEKGIAEGLYRDNMDIPVVVTYYVNRFDLMFNEDLFPREKYNPADIYLELFRYHIRGIASDKGVAYLSEKMKTELKK